MVLTNVNLFYPSAREWMWNYCIYLGSYTDTKGDNYDLGIHIDESGDISAAIVDGDIPGDYYSGDLNGYVDESSFKEIYKETIKRAQCLGLMK